MFSHDRARFSLVREAPYRGGTESFWVHPEWLSCCHSSLCNCSWLLGLFWLFSSSLLSHPVGRRVLRCCAPYTVFLKMSLPFRSHCPSPVSDYCGVKVCLHGPSNYPSLIFHDLPIGTPVSGPFHSSVLPLLCLPWTLSQAACICITHPLNIQLKHLHFKCFSWRPSSNWFCLYQRQCLVCTTHVACTSLSTLAGWLVCFISVLNWSSWVRGQCLVPYCRGSMNICWLDSVTGLKSLSKSQDDLRVVC